MVGAIISELKKIFKSLILNLHFFLQVSQHSTRTCFYQLFYLISTHTQ